MVPATNSLSFSPSSMEMLSSSQYQFISNESSSTASPHFLIGDLYSNDNSQTETQDSSLTHIYDQGSAAYFNEHQDLKTITGFQNFSTNSGSEVDDSTSVARTQVGGIDLGSSSYDGASNGLSVGANQGGCSKKAVGSVESDCSKKVAAPFGQRTSMYRGVTRHRWTGRYEAHLWDNSCKREGQARKGRQVYLGGYDMEDKAARAYDLAALKYWGLAATTNFPISDYTKELEEMKHVSKQEFIASLRRKSTGFSRGVSMYRGVTRHHQQGRWQARIGRVAGNKDLYLGTFATQEEAAEAYDVAAIKFRGINAVTNFEMNQYDVEAIMRNALPTGTTGCSGSTAKRLKLPLEWEQKPTVNQEQQPRYGGNGNNVITFATIQPVPPIPCCIPLDAAEALYQHNLQTSNKFACADSSGSSSSMTILPQTAGFYIWSHQP
ncbi:hypothetical protein K2173_014880 [Erythroxylum novogranatense]|uniref:AP2/ERF domain-containing protein n=1 Tax=Erythroxylum novogranatense TaxID=1862640 RepID=A0AAV8THL5_9ROSI|nr:hypothetical protein K2173_014880 [Erythroxylum novogranatense]